MIFADSSAGFGLRITSEIVTIIRNIFTITLMHMRLFISYAHVDKALVEEWIVEILRSGKHDVWFDDRLVAGQDWQRQLGDAIQNSDALVYALTPESVASEYCQWELAEAVRLGKPVIPVLLQAKTSLPQYLTGIQYVDFTEGPTGDAVARLMGGLQYLAPAEMPSMPSMIQSISDNVSQSQESQMMERILKWLRDPAFQAIIAVIAVAVTVLGIWLALPHGDSPPSTPVVEALANLDVRSGPDAHFPLVSVLFSGNRLDVLGISEDHQWYQVVLPSGATGWVSSDGAQLHGNQVLRVIVPTFVPTGITAPGDTPSPTATSTASGTPTDITTTTSTLTPNEDEIRQTATRRALERRITETAVSVLTPARTATNTATITLTQTATPTATPSMTFAPTATPNETQVRQTATHRAIERRLTETAESNTESDS